jgi:hypothetical protein
MFWTKQPLTPEERFIHIRDQILQKIESIVREYRDIDLQELAAQVASGLLLNAAVILAEAGEHDPLGNLLPDRWGNDWVDEFRQLIHTVREQRATKAAEP